MTPRLWFSLALRILGAWLATEALIEYAGAFNVLTRLYMTAATWGYFLVYGVVKSAMAVVLLRFAPLIAFYFYPDNSDQGSNNT
jgi:hypothetical protein